MQKRCFFFDKLLQSSAHLYPTCETGALDVNTLGNINAQTTGSIVALCVSGIIAFIVAAIEYKSGKEKPFEWETMREGIKRVEQAPRTPLFRSLPADARATPPSAGAGPSAQSRLSHPSPAAPLPPSAGQGRAARVRDDR